MTLINIDTVRGNYLLVTHKVKRDKRIGFKATEYVISGCGYENEWDEEGKKTKGVINIR